MLKFFKHIRQRFISEGKTKKYLLYATGEIILVVIGILMAENLAPTLKGGFSKYHYSFYSADIPFLHPMRRHDERNAYEGVRKGKIWEK